MQQSTKDAIKKFIEERNWQQYHSPENLAKSISIEAGESLECFQWTNEFELDDVKDELADVLIYVIDLAEALNLDLDELVLRKIEKNAVKYPVEKAYGSAKKYDKLS